MKNDNDSSEKTSRRQFTKTMVTAAIAAPIAASFAGCANRGDQTGAAPSPSPTKVTGPTITRCSPGAHIEEHIPPMGLGGDGSLRIELSNRLKLDGGGPPFKYVEDGLDQTPHDRYGELESVLVVSEFFPKNSDNEYVSIANYVGLPIGSQLLLWYQKILGNTEPPPNSPLPDADFETVATFPDNDPAVRIKGGAGNGDYFSITVKHKRLPVLPSRSHKKARPWRYHHESDAAIGGLGRHFRIGQWRIVRSDGQTIVAPNFEGRGANDYRLYPIFQDFHGT